MGRLAAGLLFVYTVALSFCIVHSSDLSCELNIVGSRGSSSGISAASLKCDGDALQAAGDAQVLAPFEKSLSGVKLIQQKNAGTSDCLLTIHGNSNATFRVASITGVPFSTPAILLCVDGASNITFEGLQLKSNMPVGIRVGAAATVTITKGSQLSYNRNRPILAMGSGKVLLTGCSRMQENKCTCNGAGILATDNAMVRIAGASSLSGNRAIPRGGAGSSSSSSRDGTSGSGRGGAVYAEGSATVVVTEQSDISGNVAAHGGGFAAAGGSSVIITNGGKLLGNVAAMQLGGGILAIEQSNINISNEAVFQGNNAADDTKLLGVYDIVSWQPPPAQIPQPAAAAAAAPEGAEAEPAGEAALDMPAAAARGDSMPTVLASMTAGIVDMVVDPSDPASLSPSPTTGGGAVAAFGTSRVTVSGSSTFQDNVAVNSSGGAVLATEEVTLDIGPGTAFISNVAQHQHGGGLMITRKATARIRHAIFTNNTAYGGVGGSVAAFGNSSVSLVNTTFFNNTAFYDMSLGLGGGSVQGEGGAVYAAGYVALNVTDRCNFTLNKAMRAYDASVGPRVKYTDDATSNARSVLVMRSDCMRGEVKRLGWCERCAENHFSLDNIDTECKVCPHNATCPGGDAVMPHRGYWRSCSNSTQIHKCPNPDACKEGGGCEAGYEGRLCGSCIAGYGHQKPFKCGKCRKYGSVLAVYVLGAVVLLALITYIVNTTLEDNLSERQLLWPSDLLRVFITYVWYLLIVASIRLPWHDYITAVFTACGVVMSITSSEVMSLDCLLRSSDSAEDAAAAVAVQQGRALPLAIKKQIVYLLVPVGMFLAAIGIQLLLRWWQRKRQVRGIASQVDLLDQLPVIAIVVVFFFHVPLCQLGLSMFACTIRLDTHEDNPYPEFAGALDTAKGGYWTLDTSQACNEGWHWWWAMGLGLPCVLLFCLVVPVATFVVLFRKRHELQERSFQKVFGSLYRTYKKERYYWEAVVAVQTVILASVSVFSHTVGVYYATLLLNAALGAIILMQLLCQPFEFNELDHLQLVATGCLLITSYAGLSFLTFDREVKQGYIAAMCVIMAVLNVAFTLWCGFCIWKSARETAAGAMQSLRTMGGRSIRYIQNQLGMSPRDPVTETLQSQDSAVEKGRVVVVAAQENGGDKSPPAVVTCTGSVDLSRLASRRSAFVAVQSDVTVLETVLDQDRENL